MDEKDEGIAPESEKESEKGIALLFRFISPEHIAKQSVVHFKLIKDVDVGRPVFFLPGYEGTSSIFDNLANKLITNSICFQFVPHQSQESIQDIAQNVRQVLLQQKKSIALD